MEPSALATVPFPRDSDFVSRDTLLDRIRDKSLVLGSRIALVGLGGYRKKNKRTLQKNRYLKK
ncbi:hypothetical protein PENANT_c146G08000 [Penicillium antarcticum]|uniref:Uncharacterized protein n=1 Tax=Penicillium antarcticum TaxID=416450 RepID=A0A1V6PFI8_9EURO|nr:hypothetical protein PENANT_c146G08000 [Penicillium antarcticum]